jgi:hypothetical protein
VRYFAVALALAGGAVPAERPLDAFSAPARARVFVFARTDCPITNRYAPELQRIAGEFAAQGVEFWMVYPDAGESPTAIEKHMAAYRFPGRSIRDPKHELMARAQATIAPQAAVFDAQGKLVYSGRIDDRYVDFGKFRPAPTVHDLGDAVRATLAGKPVAQPRTRAIGCFLADVPQLTPDEAAPGARARH